MLVVRLTLHKSLQIGSLRYPDYKGLFRYVLRVPFLVFQSTSSFDICSGISFAKSAESSFQDIFFEPVL